VHHTSMCNPAEEEEEEEQDLFEFNDIIVQMML
jgi:hypothetical protein